MGSNVTPLRSPWWDTPEGQKAQEMLKRDEKEEYAREYRMWRKRQLIGSEDDE